MISYLVYAVSALAAANLIFLYVLSTFRVKLKDFKTTIASQDSTIEKLTTFINNADVQLTLKNTQTEGKVESRLVGMESRQEVAIKDLHWKLKGFQNNFMNNY